MSEEVSGSHWEWSCRISRALGGQAGQPMCARAWANGWTCFIEAMALAFRDPCHCEAIFIRWLAMQEAPPLSGNGRPRAGY